MREPESLDLAPVKARQIARALREGKLVGDGWRESLVGAPADYAAMVAELVPSYVERPPSPEEIWSLVGELNARR